MFYPNKGESRWKVEWKMNLTLGVDRGYLWLAGNEGTEKNGNYYNGLRRDWHKDPFLHSQLPEGKAKAPRDV